MNDLKLDAVALGGRGGREEDKWSSRVSAVLVNLFKVLNSESLRLVRR